MLVLTEREERVVQKKNIWRNNSEKFSKFDGNYESTDLRSSVNPKQDKQRRVHQDTP